MSMRLRLVQVPLPFAFHDILTLYQLSKAITVFGRQRSLHSERLYVGIQHHNQCYGRDSNCDFSRQKLTVLLISRLQRSHLSDRLTEQHQFFVQWSGSSFLMIDGCTCCEGRPKSEAVGRDCYHFFLSKLPLLLGLRYFYHGRDYPHTHK